MSVENPQDLDAIVAWFEEKADLSDSLAETTELNVIRALAAETRGLRAELAALRETGAPGCIDHPASPCRLDVGSHGPREIHDHPAGVSR